MIDFHNHVLAGVDDGANDDEESRATLQAFADAGATAVIATPHVDASLAERPDVLDRRLREIDAAYGHLQEWATVHLPELRLEVGAEVRLDTPFPDLSDGRLRLAGGRFVLVEFSFSGLPPNSERPLQHIVESGYRPIVAHPERYRGLGNELETPLLWRNSGALLQVNGASLLGRYGERAQEKARALLELGVVDYLCSDYHARGTLPVSEYIEWLQNIGAAEQAELLTTVNPERLLRGEEPLPVEPVQFAEPATFWQGMAARLRSFAGRA